MCYTPRIRKGGQCGCSAKGARRLCKRSIADGGGAMLLARALLKKRTFFCELVKTPLVWRDGPPLDPDPIAPQQDLKTRRKAETVTKA